MRNIVQGKIQGNEQGYGFLLPEDGGNDYFIPHGDLRGAMHGDTVLAETTDGYGGRTTARVLKVISRGIEKLVGTYFTCKRGGFVTPDDRRYFCDIFVPFGKGVRARSGEKVVCRILCYPKRKNPEGIVTEVFGRQFDKKAELKSVLFNYDLPVKFDKETLAESKAVAKERLSKSGRKDFTAETVITIDGEDAKDFDDAISLRKDGDKYILGVHIADVSHFVKTGGALDKTALNRGTSVYFPESVIPMLPEELSNGVCSLKEGELRYTLSCVMTVNKKGSIENYEITPSVIRSKARMTYTAVQGILDGDRQLAEKYKEIVPLIRLCDELADILIKKRDENGNIDLESTDSVISVGNGGEISVKRAVQSKSQRIIEEFMIAANCTVAEFAYYADIPFVYRVHEKPAEEKLAAFYEFVYGLGLKPKRKKDETYPKDFQLILKAAEDKPYYSVLNRITLRTMQKAKYSVDPTGHFGLSLKHYCHFTSPIRRYPDLIVHRIIKDLLKNGSGELYEKYSDAAVESARISSERERVAQDAERAVDDFYKILYISNYEGEEFDGVISGVKEHGIFVELECGVEGKIKTETLRGRRYYYDEKNLTLSNGSDTYKIGEKIRIKVVGVDLITRKAEFLAV
ncbi:MAG: ribonuclease R [Clostridia bacterium]|nr:ribonuclease R [Clostridia bacterium]